MQYTAPRVLNTSYATRVSLYGLAATHRLVDNASLINAHALLVSLSRPRKNLNCTFSVLRSPGPHRSSIVVTILRKTTNN